jgi:hypothetical protein
MPHAHEGVRNTPNTRLDRPVLGAIPANPQTTHVLVLVVLTLVCGLGVGLTRGGTLSALARVHVYRPWLFAGLVLVLAVGGLVPALHSPAWILAAVLAALFAGMNNRLPGLGLLLAGIIANAAAITANGGEMPVSLWGARRAGVPIDDILVSAFHTPAGDGTNLRLLSDIIPFPFPGVHAVVSVGDVAIAAALGVFGAVTPIRAWRTLQARRNAALAGALPAAYGGVERPSEPAGWDDRDDLPHDGRRRGRNPLDDDPIDEAADSDAFDDDDPAASDGFSSDGFSSDAFDGDGFDDHGFDDDRSFPGETDEGALADARFEDDRPDGPGKKRREHDDPDLGSGPADLDVEGDDRDGLGDGRRARSVTARRRGLAR